MVAGLFRTCDFKNMLKYSNAFNWTNTFLRFVKIVLNKVVVLFNEEKMSGLEHYLVVFGLIC
jgi:hypothetical protein